MIEPGSRAGGGSAETTTGLAGAGKESERGAHASASAVEEQRNQGQKRPDEATLH